MALAEQPSEDAGHGNAAGAIGAENLAEESPERPQRRVHLLASGGLFLAQRCLEPLGGEDIGQG